MPGVLSFHQRPKLRLVEPANGDLAEQFQRGVDERRRVGTDRVYQLALVALDAFELGRQPAVAAAIEHLVVRLGLDPIAKRHQDAAAFAQKRRNSLGLLSGQPGQVVQNDDCAGDPLPSAVSV